MLRELLPLSGPIVVSFLYLKLEVDDVVMRIATRGREEEKGISRDYLQTLEQAHVAMEKTLTEEGLGIPNLVGTTKHVHVDARRTPKEVAEAVVESIEKLLAADAFARSFDVIVKAETAAIARDVKDFLAEEGVPHLYVDGMSMADAEAEVQSLRNGLREDKTVLTAASLSKYEGCGLNRTESEAEHIGDAEALKPAILDTAERSRRAMQKARSHEASPRVSQEASPVEQAPPARQASRELGRRARRRGSP